MDIAQKLGLGRRFGEFIMLIASGRYDGKVGRSQLIGETGLSVESGDLTRVGQKLLLEEWKHPRRRVPSREEKLEAWSPPVMCEVEASEEIPGGG